MAAKRLTRAELEKQVLTLEEKLRMEKHAMPPGLAFVIDDQAQSRLMAMARGAEVHPQEFLVGLINNRWVTSPLPRSKPE